MQHSQQMVPKEEKRHKQTGHSLLSEQYVNTESARPQNEPAPSGSFPWESKWKKPVSICALLLLLAIMLFFIKAYLDGQFQSVDSLRRYIDSFGILGPAVLTLFQALQVIFPVLPGFVGCAAGALLFGASGGFWYNYLGISAGSIIAFFLARRYGVSLVRALFPKEQYDKWSGLLGKSRYFTLLLFAAILLPLAPDDFLCYFSGLTAMNARKFVWIIILGKPWCILAYSLVFSGIL